MPMKPMKPCSKAGCNQMTRERFCEDHLREYRRRSDQERGTAAERGYNARWRKARAWYLKRHPLCRQCEMDGVLTPATVVDHITPHKGDYNLMWDTSNWQSLCKRCHDIKTATEDGGFGHGRA